MNWDAIGAISELLAAIGVIGSLVYVGSQVKASALASSVEAKLASTEMLTKYQDMLIENPELNLLMIKGRKGMEQLSKEEKLVFSNLSLKAAWFLSAGYFQYTQKTLSDEDWFQMMAIVIYWTSSPGFQQWWASFGKHNFSGKFAAFIENQIATAEIKG